MTTVSNSRPLRCNYFTEKDYVVNNFASIKTASSSDLIAVKLIWFKLKPRFLYSVKIVIIIIYS